MHDLLKAHDSNLIELRTPDGVVRIAPGLQGRIFCELAGEPVHRLDAALLANPSHDSFNNFGGNSLWPAPEGGPLAFNYHPMTQAWWVPPGIARECPEVLRANGCLADLTKRIRLLNRKGVELPVVWRRMVHLVHAPCPGKLRAVAYRTEDSLAPEGDFSPEEVLLAPWSLEQFPGGEGVIAFATAQRPGEALNSDFYASPPKPWFGKGFLALPLGGKEKFQIGIRCASGPGLLGALDRRRGLLVLRETPLQTTGRYFNIADNEQPRGPWSAADLYSVFNGGADNFYELETIAPLQEREGRVATSMLISRTTIYKGAVDTLEHLLLSHWSINLEQCK